MPYTGPRCSLCGRPTDSPETGLCAKCIDRRPFYDQLFYYGLFEGTLKEALHHLKYRPLRRLAKPLIRFMDNLIIPEGVDMVVPVPLHKKRLIERGFNQSALLAKAFADNRGLPFDPLVLRRKVHNPPQSQLKRAERIKNVHNIFDATGNVEDKTIVLFDDVITTGATVNECAKALKSRGSAQVYVVALARA